MVLEDMRTRNPELILEGTLEPNLTAEAREASCGQPAAWLMHSFQHSMRTKRIRPSVLTF